MKYFKHPKRKLGHLSASEALRAELDAQLAAGGDPGEILIGFLGRTLEALINTGYLGPDQIDKVLGEGWEPVQPIRGA